jgi:hypothetical protein
LLWYLTMKQQSFITALASALAFYALATNAAPSGSASPATSDTPTISTSNAPSDAPSDAPNGSQNPSDTAALNSSPTSSASPPNSNTPTSGVPSVTSATPVPSEVNNESSDSGDDDVTPVPNNNADDVIISGDFEGCQNAAYDSLWHCCVFGDNNCDNLANDIMGTLNTSMPADATTQCKDWYDGENLIMDNSTSALSFIETIVQEVSAYAVLCMR